MPTLTPNQKTYLGDLAREGDMNARGYVDHEAELVAIRKGVEGCVIVARFATTGAITLATTGLAVIDGVTPVAGDIALVKDQVAGAQNGLYIVSSAAWVRLDDVNGKDVINPGMLVPVVEGTVNAGTLYELTTAAPITVGTTALTFAQAAITGVSSASLAAVGGAALVGIADTLGVITGTTVEAALEEIAGSFFSVQGTLTFAQANAGLPLITDGMVPTGKKAYLEGMQFSVGGATAWSATASSTKLVLADTAAVELAEILVSSLTANALGGTGIDITTVVWKKEAMNGGTTASKGLSIQDDGTHDMVAGSTISFRVWGRFQ